MKMCLYKKELILIVSLCGVLCMPGLSMDKEQISDSKLSSKECIAQRVDDFLAKAIDYSNEFDMHQKQNQDSSNQELFWFSATTVPGEEFLTEQKIAKSCDKLKELVDIFPRLLNTNSHGNNYYYLTLDHMRKIEAAVDCTWIISHWVVSSKLFKEATATQVVVEDYKTIFKGYERLIKHFYAIQDSYHNNGRHCYVPLGSKCNYYEDHVLLSTDRVH